jgi:hypothetical protein
MPGCHVTRGKEVVEVSVVEAGKGVALDRLREQVAAEGVLYAGDDVTDENAFAVLRPGDIGVKVGDGETLAATGCPTRPPCSSCCSTWWPSRDSPTHAKLWGARRRAGPPVRRAPSTRTVRHVPAGEGKDPLWQQ